MTDGTPQAPCTPSASYSDAVRARVLLAHEACELAELARAAVPIGAHEVRPNGTVRSPGAALADAVQLLAAARHLLDTAVVYERAGGASWRLVGAALGVPEQAARARFAPAETRFRDALRAPEPRGGADWWRSHLLREPWEAARDLDDWVRRHADGDEDPGAAPVSGALARAERAGSSRQGDRRGTGT
ncbi:hypothetical protein [Streptomyces sp. G45]|uniref:hypothetical protein n=1 Tax=Streptomyces sp. G45 TaxID=3406627 RepID=UPI003C1643D2